ncbi:MAG: hypothetical protein IJB88_05540 [Clostridia bacterium]|nr:hypothetical protein [Clostridia bacterium]
MKRFSVLLIALLLLTVAVLASCGENGQDSSAPQESVAEQESSEAESEDEVSQTVSDKNAINVLYNRFSEKPYFAMVGTCAENAVITAECDGETVVSKSYKGWFSVRLRCDGSSVDVTLTQTVDGEQVGEAQTINAKPGTPSPDMWPVVTGGDFQFFFQKMLPDLLGQNVPSKSVYDNLTKRVSQRVAQLREYNADADVIYLIVPSSMSVYPELVPESYGEPADETRLDLTIDAINAGGGVAIDLKALFAEHKEDEMPMYYKLDSHWSDYGAYLAYVAMFEHIAKKYPDAAPRSIDEFDWNPDYYQSGDMTYYLSMAQSRVKEYAYYRTFLFDAPSSVTNTPRYRSAKMLCYSDQVTAENKIKTNRDNLPSAIVLRDSYSTQLYDILAERMDTTHYLGMWDLSWKNSLIQSEKPDYVIYILAEWNLDSVLYN